MYFVTLPHWSHTLQIFSSLALEDSEQSLPPGGVQRGSDTQHKHLASSEKAPSVSQEEPHFKTHGKTIDAA